MLICFRPTVQYIYGSCPYLVAIQAEPRGVEANSNEKAMSIGLFFYSYAYSMSLVHSLENESPTLSLLHPSFYTGRKWKVMYLHFAIILSPEI